MRIALQRVLGAMGLLRVEQPADLVNLVQQLLEPQLVDLVDDDEQRLVVLGSLGPRLLQRQQIVELQIRAVRNRPSRLVVGRGVGCHR